MREAITIDSFLKDLEDWGDRWNHVNGYLNDLVKLKTLVPSNERKAVVTEIIRGVAKLEELIREREILDAFAREMMKRPLDKRQLTGQEADRIVAGLQELGEAQA